MEIIAQGKARNGLYSLRCQKQSSDLGELRICSSIILTKESFGTQRHVHPFSIVP